MSGRELALAYSDLFCRNASVYTARPGMEAWATGRTLNMHPTDRTMGNFAAASSSLHVLLHLVSCRPEPISDDVMLARLLALCQAQPHYQTGRHVVQVGRRETGRVRVLTREWGPCSVLPLNTPAPAPCSTAAWWGTWRTTWSRPRPSTSASSLGGTACCPLPWRTAPPWWWPLRSCRAPGAWQ